MSVEFDMENIKKHGFKVDNHIIINPLLGGFTVESKKFRKATDRDEVLKQLKTKIRKLNKKIIFQNISSTDLLHISFGNALLRCKKCIDNEIIPYISTEKIERYVKIQT